MKRIVIFLILCFLFYGCSSSTPSTENTISMQQALYSVGNLTDVKKELIANSHNKLFYEGENSTSYFIAFGSDKTNSFVSSKYYTVDKKSGKISSSPNDPMPMNLHLTLKKPNSLQDAIASVKSVSEVSDFLKKNPSASFFDDGSDTSYYSVGVGFISSGSATIEFHYKVSKSTGEIFTYDVVSDSLIPVN